MLEEVHASKAFRATLSIKQKWSWKLDYGRRFSVNGSFTWDFEGGEKSGFIKEVVSSGAFHSLRSRQDGLFEFECL